MDVERSTSKLTSKLVTLRVGRVRFSLALDEAARAPQHEDEGGVEAPEPTTVKAGHGSGRFPVITGTKSGAIEVRTYERVLRLEWRPARQPRT